MNTHWRKYTKSYEEVAGEALIPHAAVTVPVYGDIFTIAILCKEDGTPVNAYDLPDVEES